MAKLAPSSSCPCALSSQQQCNRHGFFTKASWLQTSKRKKRCSEVVLFYVVVSLKARLKRPRNVLYTHKRIPRMIPKWNIVRWIMWSYHTYAVPHAIPGLCNKKHFQTHLIGWANTRGWRNLFILGHQPLEIPISQDFQGECVSDSLLPV